MTRTLSYFEREREREAARTARIRVVVWSVVIFTTVLAFGLVIGSRL